MYKPTLYITVEADREHFNPNGLAVAERTWSFTAPVRLAPADEMALVLRMKCSGRPWWDADDPAQQENWENIAAPYLRNKLAIIEDTLRGFNDKRYAHYSESLHYRWMRLELAPHTLHVMLDADADDNDYIPEVFPLIEQVRTLLANDEARTFAGEGGLDVYLPPREAVEQRRTLREQEATARTAQNAAAETDEVSVEPAQPAAALVINQAELVNAGGESLVLSLA